MSREQTLRKVDAKLYGVYVTSESSTGAGCALLALRNGSMTVLIATRKLSGPVPKVAQKLITENRNSKEWESDVGLDLAREAEMRLTNVSKPREEFVGCSRKRAV